VLSIDNALLYRGGERTGQLGLIVDQRIVAGGHCRSDARLQASLLSQLADYPLADLVDDLGNVGRLHNGYRAAIGAVAGRQGRLRAVLKSATAPIAYGAYVIRIW
jgi:hypothetical protein